MECQSSYKNVFAAAKAVKKILSKESSNIKVVLDCCAVNFGEDLAGNTLDFRTIKDEGSLLTHSFLMLFTSLARLLCDTQCGFNH